MCESGHVFEKIHKKGALYLVKALDKKRWYEVEKNGGNSRCLRSQDMRHLEQSGGKAFKSQKKNVGKIKIGGGFAISGQQGGGGAVAGSSFHKPELYGHSGPILPPLQPPEPPDQQFLQNVECRM